MKREKRMEIEVGGGGGERERQSSLNTGQKSPCSKHTVEAAVPGQFSQVSRHTCLLPKHTPATRPLPESTPAFT